MSIGTKIRRARRALGIRQGELADRVACSQSHLCDIERGRRSPGLPLARRIATALRVTLDELTRSASRTDAQHLATGGRGRRAARGGESTGHKVSRSRRRARAVAGGG